MIKKKTNLKNSPKKPLSSYECSRGLTGVASEMNIRV